MFDLKELLPKKINMKLILRAAEKQIRKEVDLVFYDFYLTTETWKNRPKFEKEIVVTGDGVTGKVWTNNKIYGYINYGTKVRRAVMSRDWKSKTRKGFIGSGQGKGRVVAISKRITRPGIKAREFDKTIVRRLKKRFVKNLQVAIDNEFKYYG